MPRSVSRRTAAARAASSPPNRVRRAAVVVGQHPGRPGARRDSRSTCAISRARRPRPRRVQGRKSNDEVQLVAVAVDSCRRDGRSPQVDLADHHPVAGVLVEQRGGCRAAARACRARSWMPHAVDARPARRARRAARVLADAVDDVDAEAVDAAVEPEAQHVVHRRRRPRGCAQLRSGCSGRNRCRYHWPVGVVAASTPGRRRRPRASCSAARRRARGRASTYQSRFGVVADDARLDEPRVLVGGVVRAPSRGAPGCRARGRRRRSAVEVGERAEQRVDVAVVGDVVAEVGHRRRGRTATARCASTPSHDRWSRLLRDALEVADAVAVRVGERPRVDLVDDCIAPPGNVSDIHPVAVVPLEATPRTPADSPSDAWGTSTVCSRISGTRTPSSMP